MFPRHSTTKAITVFLAARTAKGLSPRTLETYTYRLQRFSNAYPRLPSSSSDIESFLATTGPTAQTRDSYYRLLRGFYNLLIRKKLVRHNPVLEIDQPKVGRKIARSLTTTELARLLNHPSHSTQMSAYLYLLADTGLRLSEALSITAHGIRENTIIVRGKTGERELPISPLVANMVLEALPWPWHSHSAASHAVRKAFKRAGIVGKRASAHSLRHAFVRLWEGDESLLVNILGWTSPAMLRVYKPFNLTRAVAQHRQHSPIHLTRAALAQPVLF